MLFLSDSVAASQVSFFLLKTMEVEEKLLLHKLGASLRDEIDWVCMDKHFRSQRQEHGMAQGAQGHQWEVKDGMIQVNSDLVMVRPGETI